MSADLEVEGRDSVPLAVIQGLPSADAAVRLTKFGPNELRREEGTPLWRKVAGQFSSLTIWLLIAASVVSMALGDTLDGAAIITIVILNGLVGFFQEYRAERAILALRAMAAPKARVLRDDKTVLIPAREVVPGDVLVLDAGDLVAADARLLEAHSLQTNEAPLTGESAPVEKQTAAVPKDAPLAERRDSVFLGTTVVNGTGLAEVAATGMQTELGKIADLLAQVQDEETPLQKRLDRVGRMLLYLCLGIVAIVAVLGLLRGYRWMDILLSAVSLAVAAVPEGLPAVVTIALAVGVQRMAARNVLVRRLPSVETLGCATVICTDKTGTLTTGVMTVRDNWSKKPQELFYAAAACCDATFDPTTRSGTGDPTEIAILIEAAERGIYRPAIEQAAPRVDEKPFDSGRKRMSIFRADGVLYVKGALESLVPLCTQGAGEAPQVAVTMAERGLRVLAVAVGKEKEEKNLHLLGLIGIADPPRTEAIHAVIQARRAGIRTVMLTGDHPATARAIAHEMWILGPKDRLEDVVHARVTPEEKLQIVRKWKERGEVVAMTGDGVNDAPALREAHIGIAMGKGGTEVAREASDMVLLDDNFASIVAAVREGRGIYENIRKTLVYLLAGNWGELLVVLGASVIGLPIPLTPLQLLWINLVTDGFPALALVMDPADPDLLERPPRPPAEAILGKSQWINILLTGTLQAIVTISAFQWALGSHGLADARNMAFSVIVFIELLRSFAARSDELLFWEMGAFSNLRLLAVVIASVALQITIHHLPWTERLFGISPISMPECLGGLLLGLIPVTALELYKLVRRRAAPPQGQGMAAS